MNARYSDLELCDIHMHIMDPYSIIPEQDFQMPSFDNAASIIDIMKKCGLQKVNILAVSLYEPVDLVCNPLSLYAKTLSPNHVFALAGLRRSLIAEENLNIGRQAEDLIQTGFDGFKLICKPNVRRKFNFKINDPMFNDFYALAQEKQYPVLFHIGDPATFWDKKEVPQWAVDSGWYYGDEKEIPTLDDLYTEMYDVLKRYPRLKITFAHFFFMSSDFKAAARLFEQFDNVCFDVTPGTEMYFDFSNSPHEAREFFTRYSPRISFGTDNVGANGSRYEKNINRSIDKVTAMRIFFETQDEVSIGGRKINGIGLTREVCMKLYSGNFYNFLAKDIPSAVNMKKAAEMCRTYRQSLPASFNYRRETQELLNELEIKFGNMDGN